MIDDITDGDPYDGVDDNVEILLEASAEDPNQAYLYVRIKAAPDMELEDVLIEVDDDRTHSHIHTPNCDMVSVLANGSMSQLTIMFLELFENDPTFMEAVINAIHALGRHRNQ